VCARGTHGPDPFELTTVESDFLGGILRMNKTMIRIVACFVMLACSGLVIIRDREARNATLLLTDGRVIG